MRSMRKFLLGALVLPLILVSCQKPDIKDQIGGETPGQLKFQPFIGKTTFKADEVTKTTLEVNGTKIDLFAYYVDNTSSNTLHYFTDQLEYKDNVWSTSIPRFLKDGVKNVFYSVYPAGRVNASLNAGNELDLHYTLGSGMEDLIGAVVVVDNTDNAEISTDGSGKKVTLPFNHLLAQVRLGINDVSDLGNVVITDINFNGVGVKGVYTFNTPNAEGVGVNNWTIDATNPYGNLSTTGIDTEEDTPVSITNKQTSTTEKYYLAESLMVIPDYADDATITFTFQAYDKQGKEVTNGGTFAKIDLVGPQEWNQGLRYIYILDFVKWFNDRKLTFEVSVTAWENYDYQTTDTGIVETYDVDDATE